MFEMPGNLHVRVQHLRGTASCIQTVVSLCCLLIPAAVGGYDSVCSAISAEYAGWVLDT